MAEFLIDLGAIGDEQSEIVARVDEYTRLAVAGSLEGIVTDAKGLAPGGSSGSLRNSIRSGGVQGKLSAGGMTVEIIAEAPHAAAHEYGSGLYGPKRAKYAIKPKNKKALKWAVQGAIAPGGAASAGFAFSRGVMHPGVKASRYLERAIEQNIGDLEEELRAAFEEALVKG